MKAKIELILTILIVMCSAYCGIYLYVCGFCLQDITMMLVSALFFGIAFAFPVLTKTKENVYYKKLTDKILNLFTEQ